MKNTQSERELLLLFYKNIKEKKERVRFFIILLTAHPAVSIQIKLLILRSCGHSCLGTNRVV